MEPHAINTTVCEFIYIEWYIRTRLIAQHWGMFGTPFARCIPQVFRHSMCNSYDFTLIWSILFARSLFLHSSLSHKHCSYIILHSIHYPTKETEEKNKHLNITTSIFGIFALFCPIFALVSLSLSLSSVRCFVHEQRKHERRSVFSMYIFIISFLFKLKDQTEEKKSRALLFIWNLMIFICWKHADVSRCVYECLSVCLKSCTIWLGMCVCVCVYFCKCRWVAPSVNRRKNVWYLHRWWWANITMYGHRLVR